MPGGGLPACPGCHGRLAVYDQPDPRQSARSALITIWPSSPQRWRLPARCRAASRPPACWSVKWVLTGAFDRFVAFCRRCSLPVRLASAPRSASARQIREAQLVSGITIWAVACLDDLIEAHGRPVLGQPDLDVAAGRLSRRAPSETSPTFGQAEACWAVEVAAAGGHHASCTAHQGWASRCSPAVAGLLPDLPDEHALEVSAPHSSVVPNRQGDSIRRPPYSIRTTMRPLPHWSVVPGWRGR